MPSQTERSTPHCPEDRSSPARSSRAVNLRAGILLQVHTDTLPFSLRNWHFARSTLYNNNNIKVFYSARIYQTNPGEMKFMTLWTFKNVHDHQFMNIHQQFIKCSSQQFMNQVHERFTIQLMNIWWTFQTSWSVHDYSSAVHHSNFWTKFTEPNQFMNISWTFDGFSWESVSTFFASYELNRLMNNHIADQQESWTFDERSWFTMIVSATGSWTLFFLNEEQWWTLMNFMTFMTSLYIHNVKKIDITLN